MKTLSLEMPEATAAKLTCVVVCCRPLGVGLDLSLGSTLAPVWERDRERTRIGADYWRKFLSES